MEAREIGKRKKAFDERRFVPPLVASRLRVTLPLDHPLADPARLRAWALGFAVVREGAVLSAYAGYALNPYQQAARTTLYAPAQRMLAAASLRHPGLDWDGGGILPRMLRFLPDPPSFLPLVKRASWLNLICDKTVAFLGGRAALRARLADDPEVEVHDLPHVLALQAGPAPQIGDVGRRDFVPVYRRVAQALRRVRVAEIDGLGGGFMADATNDWLDAFDKTYD